MRADAKMMRCTLPYGSVSFSGYVCARGRAHARARPSSARSPGPGTSTCMSCTINVHSRSLDCLVSTYGTLTALHVLYGTTHVS